MLRAKEKKKVHFVSAAVVVSTLLAVGACPLVSVAENGRPRQGEVGREPVKFLKWKKKVVRVSVLLDQG